jgi:hypothetical protein
LTVNRREREEWEDQELDGWENVEMYLREMKVERWLQQDVSTTK